MHDLQNLFDSILRDVLSADLHPNVNQATIVNAFTYPKKMNAIYLLLWEIFYFDILNLVFNVL